MFTSALWLVPAPRVVVVHSVSKHAQAKSVSAPMVMMVRVRRDLLVGVVLTGRDTSVDAKGVAPR